MNIQQPAFLPVGSIIDTIEVEKVLTSNNWYQFYLGKQKQTDIKFLVKEYFPLVWVKRDKETVNAVSSDYVSKFDRVKLAAKSDFERENMQSMNLSYSPFRLVERNNTQYFMTELPDGVELASDWLNRESVSDRSIKQLISAGLSNIEAQDRSSRFISHFDPAMLMITTSGQVFMPDRQVEVSEKLPLASEESRRNIYSPPEYYVGKSDVVNESSLRYSLGATLYKLASKQYPPSAVERIKSLALQHIDAKQSLSALVGDKLSNEVTEQVETLCSIDKEQRMPTLSYSQKTNAVKNDFESSRPASAVTSTPAPVAQSTPAAVAHNRAPGGDQSAKADKESTD